MLIPQRDAQFVLSSQSKRFLRPQDLGEPREAACPEQAQRTEGSCSLRRNNRVFGFHLN
jgi:hypothetical protein